MARPDDDARAALRRDEGPLAAFFDAARAETSTPSAKLLAAVLADAEAARPAAGARTGTPPRLIGALASLLRPLGGWAGAAALASCLVVGFLAGALGAGSGLADRALWPDVVALDAPNGDPADFFKLGASEG